MKKPYVYVTRKLPKTWLKTLYDIAEVGMWDREEKPVPREVLLEESKRAAGLVTMLTENIDESLLSIASELKVVANVAVGYDNINVPLCREKGVVTANTPDVLTDSTADLTFALLLAAARRVVEGAEYLKKGMWEHWSPLLLAGRDVHHQTIGIVGMGRIGEAVARRAKGFSMNILYYNRRRKPEAEKKIGATYQPFFQLLETSDFVVSLLPLTAETKHLFNEEAFQRMKKSAVFVNAGRGAVVDENALIRALDRKEIAACGLDVFENEPIGSDHPLLRFPQVVALPHIGSATLETRKNMVELAAKNVARVLCGDQPLTPIQS